MGSLEKNRILEGLSSDSPEKLEILLSLKAEDRSSELAALLNLRVKDQSALTSFFKRITTCRESTLGRVTV